MLAGLSATALAMSQKFLPEAGESGGLLTRLGARGVVAATVRAIQLLGRQFVLGRSIDEAQAEADKQRKAQPQLRFSYDMLGEGARTEADAERYQASYLNAIAAIARRQGDASVGPEGRDGISIKLSALFSRYEDAQRERVHAELLPRVWALIEQAAAADMNLTIDAEEVDRLELSLELLDALAGRIAAALPRWRGFGLAVQAYQTRALSVVEAVAAIARRHGLRFMVRLVKGAYWDGEVKRAQELGLPAYPVFTRKPHTDVNYLACARALLAHRDVIFPQFAGHNAGTIAALLQMAEKAGAVPGQDFELQRLHGMGDGVFREVLKDPRVSCRVYAPVGEHRDLLAYLVRRLLENGANSSFVHQLADPSVAPAELLRSPLLEAHDGAGPAEGLPLPRDSMAPSGPTRPVPTPPAWTAASPGRRHRHDPVDPVPLASEADVAAPCSAWPGLGRLEPPAGGRARGRAAPRRRRAGGPPARVLRPAGEGGAQDPGRRHLRGARGGGLLPLLRPAGPGPAAAAGAARPHRRAQHPAPARPRRLRLHQPLELPAGHLHRPGGGRAGGRQCGGRQAGRADPAVAARMVALLHEAGVPADALVLLHGPGETTGAALVAHPATAGVCFTGSTAVARIINRTLAAKDGPIVPLIAETGGLNAMVVDSTALPEQVVDAVVQSAFRSAGQRCSALRLLCLHEGVADGILAMLRGAMLELRLGDPADWATDVGPVIDDEAFQNLQTQIARLRREATLIGETPLPAGRRAAPDRAGGLRTRQRGQLQQELFGPVLHVVRWSGDPAALVAQINALGYGLTFGLQTRIDSRAERLAAQARIGNVYVNRNMIGAVVGVQPFGGEGLSGTGPKAGGPHYLYRFCAEQCVTINTAAAGGNAALLAGGHRARRSGAGFATIPAQSPQRRPQAAMASAVRRSAGRACAVCSCRKLPRCERA
jgi:RHH-type proline utilization regulon transcriptional repressor/proline dehydrogenase/delta 1-pyrroline-5-carboxylate dehydrogenase